MNTIGGKNERGNAYARKLYAERKEWGVCPKCGSPDRLPNFVFCPTCQEKDAAYHATYRAKNLEQEREKLASG